MHRRQLLALAAAGTALPLTDAPPAQARALQPLRLHPDNPHYFEFRGKPAVLITSGEHYGAVLNGEFNYLPYLDTLRGHGFNQTRTFAGTYREVPGSFNIQGNTLAPKPDQYLAPWLRTNTLEAVDGGAKFDLTRWNDAYFRRLKEFVRAADRRGVVVELVLFCPFYEDVLWTINPMNAANNVNGIGKVKREQALAEVEPALTQVQEAFVRKVVSELRDAENLYYEICNEPYFGGVTESWQVRMANVIADAEAGFPARHLIAKNIANKTAEVRNPPQVVSVLNFHYASPPDAVGTNYGLNRPIGFDESGFIGTEGAPYRMEAWEFLLAGGAVYSNLDYSFTTKTPDGTFPVVKPTPGSGGPELRSQLAILHRFMNRLPFVRMRPQRHLLGVVGDAAGARWHLLAQTGVVYAGYLRGSKATALTLILPEGRYRTEWLDPATGRLTPGPVFQCGDGGREIPLPAYQADLAFRVTRE